MQISVPNSHAPQGEICMLKDPHVRLEDFKINSTTTLDDLLKAAANSDEMPTIPPSQSDTAAINPAVDRCCQAYAKGLEAAKMKEKSDFASEREAQHAYRNALPPALRRRQHP